MDKNKILIVGPPKSGKLTLVKKIFNSIPEIEPQQPHSGIIHNVDLVTKYYTKSLQIWIDEFDNDENSSTLTNSAMSWIEQLKYPEFAEIREVLSGLVICVDLQSDIFATEKHIAAFAEKLASLLEFLRKQESKESHVWSGFSVVVGILRNGTKVDVDVIKEIFWDANLEFAHYNPEEEVNSGERDQYGDKLGVAKVIEIIETHDWDDIVEFKPRREAGKEHKKDKIESMTEPLLDGKDPAIELEALMKRVNLAKEKASQIQDQSEKEEFAKQFIEEIIDYL